MKTSEVIKIVKERDKLIDILILSHLNTLGKVYQLDSKDDMFRMSKEVVNHFAKDDLIDWKISKELSNLLNSDIVIKDDVLNLLENRGGDLSIMLSELAKTIRVKSLKDMDLKEYQTKF